jgi:glutamate-1-semialdehyde 2,1-aminomutase
MRRTLERSNLHFERAVERLPLGVASDCGYWGDGRTLYVKRASGARLWDIDDNEYIDYRLGGGQMILGYADLRVAKAARAGISLGGVFALATELELAVAERIAQMVSAAELVRFANSEAEAIIDAQRVAHSFTGKEAVAVVGRKADSDRCDEGSESTFDSGAYRAQSESSVKRDRFDFRSHFVPAHDVDRLDDLLKRHGDQIGALLIEPVPCDCMSLSADISYLREVRALCDRFGVVLIVDEVTTGFRVARGGAQELLGVRADLCIFGSSMASGFPIAALAGREEIMRSIGTGVGQGGRQSPHPVSLSAANKTLEILQRSDAIEKIEKFGWRLREGMSQVLSRRGVPHTFEGPPMMSCLCLGGASPSSESDQSLFGGSFCHDLAKRLHGSGILCEADFKGPWFVSSAHNELCLAETLAKFEHAIDATLERLPADRGEVDRERIVAPDQFASPS